jgi:hypothetical protein
MYLDGKHGVLLHTGGSGKYCTSKAKDNVLSVCSWYFIHLKQDPLSRAWFESQFGQPIWNTPSVATCDMDVFGEWLFEQPLGIFNFILLITRLYTSVHKSENNSLPR